MENCDLGLSLNMLEINNSPPIHGPMIKFQSVRECYSIGDIVELQIKSVEHVPSSSEWIGLFPCDAESSDKPLSSEYISKYIHDTDTDTAPIIDLGLMTLLLELDFPVKEDMVDYEVRYITETNVTLGKSDSFRISFVPHDEACCEESENAITLAETNNSFEDEKIAVEAKKSMTDLLVEIERRERAEIALENLSRKLGEQMNVIDAQKEEVMKLTFSHDRELSLKEELILENKELQIQADVISNEFKKTQATLLNYKSECGRLSKELETTDKENSCLKFHIVNSEERLESEEHVLNNKVDQDTDVWNECKTLTHNIELLEEVLQKERYKVQELEEELHSKEQRYELEIVVNKNMILQYKAEVNDLKEEIREIRELENASNATINTTNKTTNTKACETANAEMENCSLKETNNMKEQVESANETSKAHEAGNLDIEDQCTERKNSLKEELMSVIEALEKERSRVKKLEETLHSKGQQFDLEKKNMSVRHEVEINNLKEELESVANANNEVVKAYEMTITEMKVQEVQNTAAKINSLKEELESAANETEQTSNAYEARILDIKDQFTTMTKSLNEELKSVTETLEKERSRVKELEEEFYSKGKQHDSEMEVKRKMIVQYEEKINNLKEELETVTNTSIETTKGYEATITEMKVRECHCTEKINNLKEELESVTNKGIDATKAYEARIWNMESLCKLKKDNMDEELESVAKEAGEKHEKLICKMKKDIKSLEKKLESQNAGELKREYDIDLNRLKDEIESCKCTRKESDKAYEKTIEDLESRVANESSNASRLENDLAIAELRCRESEEDVKFFRQQLLDTEKKLQDGQSLLSKTLEEMNNLKNKLRRSNIDIISRDVTRDKDTFCDMPPPSAACGQNATNIQLNSKSNIECSTNNARDSSSEVNNSKSLPNMDVLTSHNNQNSPDVSEEPRMIPGIVKFNPNNQYKDSEIKNDSSKINAPQPISVIIDGRKVPKKKGRRYSKPINLAFAPLNTVVEMESDNHQQSFSRDVNHLDRSQLEIQYDAIRQHRNSLIRENTYLKNKVSSLVTDLLLMQKNLQDVVIDAEQKLSMLQLIIGNQYALAAMSAQSEIQFYPDNTNSYQMIESPIESEIDGSNYNTDAYPTSYLSQYGVIQSPMKEKPSKQLPMSDPSIKGSPIGNLTCPSPNYLSPLAEEYTPANVNVQHNSPGMHPVQSSTQLHNNSSVDTPNPDVYLDYLFNNHTGNGYSLPFPPPLPLTPSQNDDDLFDVTQQLENIGIRF